MDKKNVIEFFDALAPGWDADMIRRDDVIKLIVDNAGVTTGARVLDIACGTGVLFPDYLARGVASVMGVDISPEMVKIAAGKVSHEPKIRVLCADAETYEFEGFFDCIVIYNALPHFPDPEALIANLAKFLAPDGRLTAAHGMSRAMIDHHHSGGAKQVSVGLMSEGALAELFAKSLTVETVISDERMYQVVGVKK
jgi:demethylmenaquinone methyltransferase/2-methoxy-6-polyprenyl-1,4-benzoquinol methylase